MGCLFCFVRRLTQYFALWTHKRYPIFRPKGRVMGCLFLILCQKTDPLFCPLNSYKTSHISASRASYGMSFFNTLSEDWPSILSFELIKDIPYLGLTGKLWDVFFNTLSEDWPSILPSELTKTPHISPSRANYGMSFFSILSEDWPNIFPSFQLLAWYQCWEHSAGNVIRLMACPVHSWPQ